MTDLPLPPPMQSLHEVTILVSPFPFPMSILTVFEGDAEEQKAISKPSSWQRKQIERLVEQSSGSPVELQRLVLDRYQVNVASEKMECLLPAQGMFKG